MLRLTARWVLPVSAPPIECGAVLVDDAGRIAGVGPDPAVPHPPGATPIALGEAALLPGLVNTHAHPELTGLRGFLEDLPFPIWIERLMHARRAEDPGAADLAARWTCIEAIAAGVTTLAATETSGAAARAIDLAGLRGIVYLEVFGPDERQVDAAMAALRTAVDDLRAGVGSRVRIGVSPHAPFSVSDALFRATAEYAVAEDLPIAVHTAESDDEERFVVHGDGAFAERLRARGMAVGPRARSTVDILARTGVLAARPLLVHCVRVDAPDIAAIAAAGASIAHCPAANGRLGHGISPVAALLDAGITVGLGSDSVASNNRIDILEEARLAQILQRAKLGNPSVLPAERVLRMATLDGARALGLDSVGALETGMDADLCALSLESPHMRPVHDPVAAIIHSARATDVVLTMVQGRILHGAGSDIRAAALPLREHLDAAAARLREAVSR